MTRLRAALALFGSMVGIACSGGPGERASSGAGTFGSGAGEAGETGETDRGDATDTEGDGDTAADGGGTKFDMAVPDAGAPPVATGCDKVDFLFVIDGSVSMANEQAALAASFPGFMDAIGDTLTAQSDYHIMVVDTDAANRCTKDACDDPTPSNKTLECCLEDGAGAHACNANFGACDETLGAGVVHPAGTDSSNQLCDLAGGQRYITEDEPDIGAAFDCIAHVGIAGDPSERPMDAMLAAVGDELAAPGGCNEGFLRDDAILVVTFITDEDDAATDGSAGTVDGWHQALVSAKNGDENAVVVLGLFGDNDQPGAICPPFNPDAASGAEPSPRLGEFVESWGDHGIRGSICAASYADFFQQAVGLIDTTCDEFEPPG
jgi:hypothetical protein